VGAGVVAGSVVVSTGNIDPEVGPESGVVTTSGSVEATGTTGSGAAGATGAGDELEGKKSLQKRIHSRSFVFLTLPVFFEREKT
jgi:hypothetical protein